MAEPLETEVRVKGLEDYIASMQEIRQQIISVGTVTDDTTDAIRELNRPVWALRRTVTGTRTAFRAYHAQLFEGIRLMNRVASIGTRLQNIFQSYTLQQIRVQEAQENVNEAQKDFGYYAWLYTRYLRDFGEESIFTQAALEDMRDAYGRLKESQKKSEEAQRDWAGWIGGTALQSAGFITDLIMMGYYMKMMASYGWSVTGSLAALGKGIVAVGTAAAPLIALAIAFFGVSEAIHDTNRALKEVGTRQEEQAKIVEDFNRRTSESSKVGADVIAEGGHAILQFFAGLIGIDLDAPAEAMDKNAASTKDFSDMLDEAREAIKEYEKDADALADQWKDQQEGIEGVEDAAITGSLFPELVKWGKIASKTMRGVTTEFGKLTSEIPTQIRVPVELPIEEIKQSIPVPIELTREAAMRTRETSPKQITIREVSITNYFERMNADSELDMAKASNTMYKKLMQELGRMSRG